MVFDGINFAPFFNRLKTGIGISQASPKNMSFDPFLAKIDILFYETLKQAIQKGRSASRTTYQFTKKFFTSDKVSMQTKATVVFAAIVLCVSPTLRSVIPLIVGPIAGAAASGIIGAVASSAVLMFMAATKVGPLFFQWLASQNRADQPRAQQLSSSDTTSSPASKESHDQWANEFGRLAEAQSGSSSSEPAHSEWAREFSQVSNSPDWVSSFKQVEANDAASDRSADKQNPIIAAPAPIEDKADKAKAPNVGALEQNPLQKTVEEFKEFLAKRETSKAPAAAPDTIEKDVQEPRSAQARRTLNSTQGMLRAITILRHLVTPVSSEEEILQAFEAERAKNPNIRILTTKAHL